MQHALQPGRLDNLIKGILLGNVRHDNDLQPLGAILVCVADLLCFFFGAHCCYDRVALREELFEDVGWEGVRGALNSVRRLGVSCEGLAMSAMMCM